MIDINDALERLLDDVKIIAEQQQTPLFNANHRIISQDQVATIDVPPADVSAMDGYAIQLNQADGPTVLPVSQRIAAGYPAQMLAVNTAARLFTGSEIPTGADTVVIQENCRLDSGQIEILELPARGANIRCRGQDIVAGTTVLSAGRKLQAQDVGLLASVGVSAVPCYRTLKIGVLSSGDELIEPGEAVTLKPGQIFNSNRYTLKGLIDSVHMEFVNLGHVRDDLAATVNALDQARNQADVIITTGGVSVGEEDHIKAAIQTLGQLQLWKLAIKPGKPLAYGNIAGTPFFGLPGNPVAVFVTFLMVVRPYLLAMQGQRQSTIEPLELRCDFSVEQASLRQEYRRIRIQGDTITGFHSQDSGVLSSTHWANGLAVIPANTTVAKGDRVQVYPFSFFNL